MRWIALKVDVDTLHGTREGALRLASLLSRHGVPATFLFSLGPDHTGRALKRLLRPGFLQKVLRTSVPRNYGLRTLLYGTLLKGPDIGRLCREEMLAVAGRGFEVGVHSWDHVGWQDGVSKASYDWTRDAMEKSVATFERIFRFSPRVHGAAGWQINAHVPMLEHQLGFEVASDTRGFEPFLPVGGGAIQLPTTLPTMDELVGLDGANANDAMNNIAARALAEPPRCHVFTLHAELEGGAYLFHFERLLTTWRESGVSFCTLGEAAKRIDLADVKKCKITNGRIAGRSGTLAVQATAN